MDLEKLMESMATVTDRRVRIEFVLPNEQAIEVIKFVDEILQRN